MTAMQAEYLPEHVIVAGPARIHLCKPKPHRADSSALASSFRLSRSASATETGRPRRPRMRVCLEILCTWNGVRRYHRVPGTAALIDAESSEQLELIRDSLMSWLQQLDGKYLAGPPPDPAAPISDGEPR